MTLRLPTRVPTQPRAQQTRQALLEAAERELEKHGYTRTTARTIAIRAKSATGSFYQYFASKDDILREVAQARQTALIELALETLRGLDALDGDPEVIVRDVRTRMRAIVDVTMAYYAGRRGLQAVLAERRHVDGQLDMLLRAGERRVVERVAELLRIWGHTEDVEATAFVLFAALRGAVHAHVIGGAVVDDARFAAAAADALIRIALPPTFIRPATSSPWSCATHDTSSP